MNNAGHQIKTLRIGKSLSRQQLALAAGVHVNTVEGFETGRHSASVKTFVALAGALGYEVTLRRKGS